MKLINLQDLCDILKEHARRAKFPHSVVAAKCIREVQKIHDEILKSGNADNKSPRDRWLNDQQTSRYIVTLLSRDTRPKYESVAYEAFYYNEKPIDATNHLVRYLAAQKMLFSRRNTRKSEEMLRRLCFIRDRKHLWCALERLRTNKVYLSNDQIEFVMRNQKYAIGIAASAIFIATCRDADNLLQVFIDNFKLVEDHFAVYEKHICRTSSLLLQVHGDKHDAHGFVAALWRLYPDNKGFNQACLKFLMDNIKHCDVLSKALWHLPLLEDCHHAILMKVMENLDKADSIACIANYLHGNVNSVRVLIDMDMRGISKQQMKQLSHDVSNAYIYGNLSSHHFQELVSAVKPSQQLITKQRPSIFDKKDKQEADDVSVVSGAALKPESGLRLRHSGD